MEYVNEIHYVSKASPANTLGPMTKSKIVFRIAPDILASCN